MISYSFHISSKNHSINTKGDLKVKSDHNHRNYQEVQSNNFEMNLELSHHNTILKGTYNAYQDVKDFYEEYFEESRLEYNQKQSRDDRKIGDYFEKISNDSKKQLAVEIIIQLGDKNFWENKTIEERKQMDQVFQEQISFLEKNLPNFKICNAVVHHDEASPHIQLIGVPISENNKTGMEKQVSKKSVFTKESLREIQTSMRENAIDSFNRHYKTKEILKKKETGRNYDFTVAQIKEIRELEKQKELVKKELENLKELKMISTPQEKDLKNYRNQRKNTEQLKQFFPTIQHTGLQKLLYTDDLRLTPAQVRQINTLLDSFKVDILASEKLIKENLEQKEELRKLDKMVERQQNTIYQKDFEIADLRKEKEKIIQENEKNNRILDWFKEKVPNFRESYEEVKNTLYPKSKNLWEKKIEKGNTRGGWER